MEPNPIRISPEQFQLYQQQWNQPVEDGDLEGQRQKTNAGYWLAYCYLRAEGGVERNPEQEIPILEQAIQEQDRMDDNNHRDNTGKHRCLLANHVHIHRNLQRAHQLYRQAVPRLEIEVQEGGNDENFQQAAFNLGECLFFGKGVDKDRSLGIHWWKAAAELGHEGAVDHLYCSCSFDPLYVGEVFDWWLEMAGADHGHAWAQLALGDCFRCGCGVEKDLVKAVEWYNKVIAQGDNRANFHASLSMRGLLSRLSPKERNKTLGCVTRNQKIEKVVHLIEQPEPGSVPLGLWADVIATLQQQEHPPWESPSPTYLALSSGVVSQLQGPSPKQKRQLPLED